VLAIIGAGVQGRSHLKMLPRVRQFSEIRIASAHFDHAEQLAATDSRARAVESIEQAVRGADVVCLCTHSGRPVISYDWLFPGMHITSVGYSPPGGELDPKVIEHGHLFVAPSLVNFYSVRLQEGDPRTRSPFTRLWGMPAKIWLRQAWFTEGQSRRGWVIQ
jgi:ornithine cyclodeaminase/alanine dehydrogenase-like protein (mu-crystallin family)